MIYEAELQLLIGTLKEISPGANWGPRSALHRHQHKFVSQCVCKISYGNFSTCCAWNFSHVCALHYNNNNNAFPVHYTNTVMYKYNADTESSIQSLGPNTLTESNFFFNFSLIFMLSKNG